MGIRIHKKIGYGLIDVQADDESINDDRFNLKTGYFGLDMEKRENKYTFKGFIKYLQKQHDIEKNSDGFSMLTFELSSFKMNKFSSFRDILTYESEYASPNVILFQPPIKDWTRWDEIIDYMEHDGEDTGPLTRVFKRPIYPYEMWINSDTGETQFEHKGKKYHYLHVRQAINFGFDTYDDAAIKSMGFESMEEANLKVVPGIPEVVAHLCKYLKVFKDDKTIYQLKPLVYTYWS